MPVCVASTPADVLKVDLTCTGGMLVLTDLEYQTLQQITAAGSLTVPLVVQLPPADSRSIGEAFSVMFMLTLLIYLTAFKAGVVVRFVWKQLRLS